MGKWLLMAILTGGAAYWWTYGNQPTVVKRHEAPAHSKSAAPTATPKPVTAAIPKQPKPMDQLTQDDRESLRSLIQDLK